MQIEPASPVPIFRQIADGVRSAVAAGVYRPGDLIPSVRQQALTLLVNPNTVQRAYEELEREGLITSKKGLGMIVADDSRAAARDGIVDSVRANFSQSIQSARSAGLSRAPIDQLYRQAWDEIKRTKER